MTLLELAGSAFAAFYEVGGTVEMYQATTFETESQAYYAGQAHAYNCVMHQMGLEPFPPDTRETLAAFDREWEAYVNGI